MSLIIGIILITLIIYIYRFFLNRSKKKIYKKAGEKWEGVVKELSKRK